MVFFVNRFFTPLEITGSLGSEMKLIDKNWYSFYEIFKILTGQVEKRSSGQAMGR